MNSKLRSAGNKDSFPQCKLPIAFRDDFFAYYVILTMYYVILTSPLLAVVII